MAIMSHTPAYSRDQDSVPLLKGDTRSSVDLEAQNPPPAYPPHIEHVPAEEQEGISSVTYTFVPRWPMVEERQTALGVIGRTKRVSGTFSSQAYGIGCQAAMLCLADYLGIC